MPSQRTHGRAGAARNRKQLEMLARRAAVARIYLQAAKTRTAITLPLIAAALVAEGFRRPATSTLHGDMVELKIDLRETTRRDMDAEREIRLAELARVKHEAWEEWDRSKLAAETTTTEKTSQAAGDARGKISKTVKGQTGNSSYLDTIRGAIADERKMLGLDAPTKTSGEVVDVTEEMLAKLTPDELLQVESGKIGGMQIAAIAAARK